MISLRTIQQRIVAILKAKYPDYKVYFDNIEKSMQSYFYIEMNVVSHTVDRIYFDRYLQIDIAFRPKEDSLGRVKRADLYNMADELETLIRPIFYVEDRAITVLKAEQTIVDEVLHYIFDLDFTDAFTVEEQYELMQNLDLSINDKGEEHG